MAAGCQNKDEPGADKEEGGSGVTLEEAVVQDRMKRCLEEDDQGKILVKCQALLAGCGLLLGSSGAAFQTQSPLSD